METIVNIYGCSQNRIALGIIKTYIMMHPNTTENMLKNAFPNSLNSDSGMKEIFVHPSSRKGKTYKAYLLKKKEILDLADGSKLALVSMWTKNSLILLIKQAKQYGINASTTLLTHPINKNGYCIKPENKISFAINTFAKKRIQGHRYQSFDLCYDYFYRHKGSLTGNNLERSCFILFSYLASWGMLRSSELLQKSPAALATLIEKINDNPQWWDIDVNSYKYRKDDLCECYFTISEELKKILTYQAPSLTLVTKIMLGVFSNIPAFDEYFTKTMKAEEINNYKFYGKSLKSFEQAINCIHEFYLMNKKELNSIDIPLLLFNGKKSKKSYNLAKLIDMYGFQHGINNL